MDVQFPEKLQFLFQPSRYKVAYGGRGSGKSWGFARALLLRGLKEPLRVLCTRELQNSIKDSVHKLLSDQIAAMGLESEYEIQRDVIRGLASGTEFLFKGVKNNVAEIKSTEGIDVCWCEEAQTMSSTSWNIIIPTIRKPGSEIWVSFNPVLETDDTFVRFVRRTPSNALVVEVNWRDNPWFSPEMRLEMEDLRRVDEDEYEHVWEGKTKKILKGAVYEKQLRLAEAEGRIVAKPLGGVPYDRGSLVNCAFDLGRNDMTSIWFWQEIAFQVRFVHFHEDQGLDIQPYIKYLQNLPYVYGTIVLPHDGASHTILTKLSIEEQMKLAFPRVRVLPRTKSLSGDINIVRGLFPRVFFDAEGCAEGLNALRHYRYDVVQGTENFSSEPLHDEYSHAADAFRYACVSMRPAKAKKRLDLGSPSGLDEEFDIIEGELIEDEPKKAKIMQRMGEGLSRGGLGWLR